MSNEITIKFGTTDLETNMTVDDIGVREKRSSKISDIPKSDGAITEQSRRRSLTITIAGTVHASDYDALRTNLDTLRAALQNGFQKFVKDDDRYVMGQLQDFTEDIDRGSMRCIAKYRATFLVHYPFWQSETESTDARVPTSGVGFTLANNGNSPCRAKIRAIASPSGLTDAFQIENSTRGEVLKYRGTVVAGNTLEIDNRYDTDDFEVLNNDVDDIVNFEGDFINLSPGNNTIVFTGTPGTTLMFNYRDTWY